MANLRIDSATLSKSGKSYAIVAAGVKYYAKPEQGIQDHIGDTLDCEVTTSEYQGNEMLWINKYKVVDAAPAGKVYSASPPAPVWLPMASNIVAHAIQSGYIQEPTKIREWVFAVKGAIEAAIDGDVGF